MPGPRVLLMLVLAAGCGVSAAQTPSAVPDNWVSLGEPVVVAPDATGITVLRTGTSEWRLLWADEGEGLRSATSVDLRTWRLEPGLRVEGAGLRYPSTATADGQLWMVVQETTAEDRAHLREYSSLDGGVTWTRRGVAIGPAQGFDFASAPALYMNAERQRALVFSGTRTGRGGPADIYLAIAGPDGGWTVAPRPVVERAHSPTVVPMGPRQMAMLFRRGRAVEGARSRDGGLSWTEAGPVRIGTGAIGPDEGLAVTLDKMGVPMLLVAQDEGIVRFRDHSLVAPKAPGEVRSGAPPAAGAERPVAERPVAERPVAERPVAERPVAERPVAERPVAERPGADPRREADLYKEPAGSRGGPASDRRGDDPRGVVPSGFPSTFQDTGLAVVTGATRPAIAPDIVRLEDGRYRMFYLLTGGGIRSAVSDDGLRWTVEEGDRLARVERRGTPDGLCGHPTVVRIGPRKLRMYYQGLDPAGLDDGDAPLDMQLYAAVSEDEGLTWKREGLVIGTGSRWGLDFAGHGRAWVRRDGTFAMVLSGNVIGDRDPSSILMATSTDGLQWQVRPDYLFPRGHDPALVKLDDGRLVMVYGYLLDGLRVAWSDDDGETWSEPARLGERTADGRTPSARDDGVRGDVALLRLDDGEVVLFVSTEEGIVLGRASEGTVSGRR